MIKLGDFLWTFQRFCKLEYSKLFPKSSALVHNLYNFIPEFSSRLNISVSPDIRENLIVPSLSASTTVIVVTNSPGKVFSENRMEGDISYRGGVSLMSSMYTITLKTNILILWRTKMNIKWILTLQAEFPPSWIAMSWRINLTPCFSRSMFPLVNISPVESSILKKFFFTPAQNIIKF